ncbi:hypothetical protein ACFL3B_05410 [Gemmatimonadota bacterium]
MHIYDFGTTDRYQSVKEHHPTRPRALPAVDEFARAAREGTLTANELLAKYCTLVYSQTGSYQETARRLSLDRRTVKAKVDQGQLEAFGRSW